MSSPAHGPEPDPDARYETLVELAERELVLIDEDRYDELTELYGARAALIETLPQTPPPTAKDALERAAAVQQRITIELVRKREAVLLALAEVARGQRVARGYAPPRRRTPRITASA